MTFRAMLGLAVSYAARYSISNRETEGMAGPANAIQGLWRTAVPRAVRTMAQPLSLQMALSSVRGALASGEPPSKPGPLVITGFIAEAKGVSEAARLTIRGIASGGYPATVLDLRLLLNERSAYDAVLPQEEGGVWLIHANAPEALKALARLAPARWLGRYRIGYWAYELPAVPPLWVAASKSFHEIWAPSRFVVDALKASGVTTPIRMMPHPVATGESSPAPQRARFAIPTDAFATLAMGDLDSSATRKNLIGAIEIYRRAFPADDGKKVLLLKTQSSKAHPRFRAEAETAIAGRRDIIVISDTLSRPELRQLIVSCDVLLSPHRSEGFGLALAEAFLMGVPALATGWSGNLDFMVDLPELLIFSRQTSVRDRHGIYRGTKLTWAEPDADDAAAKLQALSVDPAMRKHLAAKGRAAVESLSAAWNRKQLDATALGRLILQQGR